MNDPGEIRLRELRRGQPSDVIELGAGDGRVLVLRVAGDDQPARARAREIALGLLAEALAR